MRYLLAGDIGGTKTILRLVSADGETLKTCYEKQYVSKDFPDLVPLVQAFLKEAGQQTAQSGQPEKACFAIAGPVLNNTSKLTNLTWNLAGDRLAQELQLESALLINDFEAIGYGVLQLEDNDVHPLQIGIPNGSAPVAVIGAGTGLGQGFLIPQNGKAKVFPSEGGHADFAPRSELDFQLLKYLLDKHQIARISAERVVSGQGVVSIYQFLRDRGIAQESPELSDIVTTWEKEAGQAKSVDPAAAISQFALKGEDDLAVQTMNMFVSAYGAEAGNLALKLLPYGGLYIAGGIAAKNLPLITNNDVFLDAFTHKGRMSKLLEDIPVRVVLNPQVGLIGAAWCAATL
ncbi:glucokinase [Oscillatoria sp. CS-180]|uniref:glucokinase n=1 Tax=Oscillatoria sp. CS-180 TaxID=3021720 RepID=UPI00232EFDA6|nr:glucokinase [Oscillatoria sp. CS-180]MDB9527554.1 glucokinase [Oscillatoria sp. CS-180]